MVATITAYNPVQTPHTLQGKDFWNWVQQSNYLNQVQNRVEDAKRAGINPLAAMGISGGYTPTFSSGTHDGNSGFSEMLFQGLNMAQGIAGIAQMFQSAPMQRELADLGIEHAKLQNDYMKAQVNALSQVQSPGITPATTRIDTAHTTPGPVEPDLPDLLFKPVIDLDGSPRLVINQDVVEGDSDNAGYVSSLLSQGLANGQIDKLTGKVKSDQVRMMLDDFYYKKTGHHIPNLEQLYISPTEVAIAVEQLARGSH